MSFSGAGRWGGHTWKLPEGTLRIPDAEAEMGFQRRMGAEARLYAGLSQGLGRTGLRGHKRAHGPGWLKGDREKDSFLAHTAQGLAIFRVTPKRKEGRGLVVKVSVSEQRCRDAAEREGWAGSSFPKSREGGEGRRMGSQTWTLLLQGREVGRPCGHQPRDTVSLLPFSVVPGQACCRHAIISEQVGELQGQPTPQPNSFLWTLFCVTGSRLVPRSPLSSLLSLSPQSQAHQIEKIKSPEWREQNPCCTTTMCHDNLGFPHCHWGLQSLPGCQTHTELSNGWGTLDKPHDSSVSDPGG